MRFHLFAATALVALMAPGVQAQMDPHQHHRVVAQSLGPQDHSAHAHSHDVGPALPLL